MLHQQRRFGNWPTRGWGTSAQPHTSHSIADHEWRCWPLHKNAMAELAHIGNSGRVLAVAEYRPTGADSERGIVNSARCLVTVYRWVWVSGA